MQLLESYDEYKDMVRRLRKKCDRPFSNVYFMQNDMERYIQLGRVSYEETEGGIIFYFDEEKYYRVCLCVSDVTKLFIGRKDKKILVKNVFQKDRKKENLQCVEQQLGKLGFKKADTSVKIRGDVQKLYQKFVRMEKYADALEKKGYRCITADFSMLQEIEEMILDSGIIKDYQLNYWTDEEKKRMAEKGSYLCIVNHDYQICAAATCIIGDTTIKGMTGVVKEKYKMHGLIVALAYHRLKWLYENGFKSIQGWILTDNEPSLRYHQSMGYEFMNEYADEWILAANEFGKGE